MKKQVLDQNVVVDPGTTYQTIRGFGGMNGPGWISDLTSAQVDLAFGKDTGQIGLTIMRMRIDPDSANWPLQTPSAARAKTWGASLLGTVWSPPAYMKSNNSLVNGGKLLPQYYSAFADHLRGFASYMAENNAVLLAISPQNEPDWHPNYESGDWSGEDFVNFLNAQGTGFSNLKLLIGETMGFNFAITDPVLNNATASQCTDIIGGHLYGAAPKDYPLARSKGKEIWMTEHYTDNNDGNVWPSALGVASEIHQCMTANFNAYVWWYIRRSYGLISESGMVSKRGFVMSHFARFVRPWAVRISVTEKPYDDVLITAYKTPENKLVLVVINTGMNSRFLNLTVPVGMATKFVKYRTSSDIDVNYAGTYDVNAGVASFYADPQSVATLVSDPII